MTTFTREEARNLMVDREGPLVSLLMPVHDPGQALQQDGIRLRNLLRVARADLLALGLRAPSADQLLEPCARLLDASAFWTEEGQGVALFAAEDFFQAYRVPVALPKLAVVADAFHIKPLLSLLQADGVFYVLALSGREARLLQCTRDQVRRVTVPDLPRGQAAMLVDSVHEPPVHAHGANHRTAAPHAVDGFDRAVIRAEYFRAVDRAVRSVVREAEGPLILAGVTAHHSLWSRVTTSPTLLADPVTGNWDDATDTELHDLAWPRAEALFATGHARDVARYDELRGSSRATNDLRRVLRVARLGQVDTLFVPVGVQRWGIIDRPTGEVGSAEPGAPGAVDLLNEAAILTLKHGGAVHATSPEDTPDQGLSGLNAILRW